MGSMNGSWKLEPLVVKPEKLSGKKYSYLHGKHLEMDVVKLLRDVKDFKGYVSITEDMVKNIANLKLQFNMATVQAIKNIQSFELQYFNKFNKTGAASIMFELLLKVPTTKYWNAIGKELVLVIQYWLAGVRKYLITQNEQWWKFMRTILEFIEKLYLKHQLLVSSIVQKTAECMLDLATRTESSTEQRYQILIRFNLCSTLTQRELRHALLDKLDKYFIKLALWLPRCGDMFAQYKALETLMRWLLPRQDARARELAAARWLPSPLYPSQAVQLFLERPWLSFYRDARSFLNAVNESGDSIVSILIEKLSLGNITIINNRTTSEHWLDLNVGSSTLSVMLDTSIFKALCVKSSDATDDAYLLISEGNIATMNMYSGARETMILVKVVDPLQLFPAKILENKHDVRVYISPKTNIQRVDNTLRRIFDKKYQLLRESFSEASHSADSSRNIDYVWDQDTRFSIPADILRQKLLEQRAKSAQSPSSASTTSLAMLRDILQDIPDDVFDKEIRRFSVKPQLQTVSEVSEKTSHSSLIRPDPSSTDIQNLDLQNCIQSIDKGTDENANNDRCNKNLDIINQLAQEAFQYSRLHASMNTHDHNDIIDNTQSANVTTRSRRCDKREFNRKPELINIFTTIDDSNTAFVENTPAVDISKTRVSNRKARGTHTDEDKTKDSKDSGFGQQVYDNKTVEAFFSKHVAENKHGDLIVSPTLGRKINDSNSGSSSSFTLRPHETESGLNFNLNMEVADCLNFIVDKVCENLEKDIENLRQNLNRNNILNNSQIEADRSMHLEEATNKVDENKKKSTRKAKGKTPVNKLKFKNTKEQTKVHTISRMPAIDEKDSDLDKTARSSKGRNSMVRDKKSPTDTEIETPLNNRKRKLYSKKDDSLIHARTGLHVSETETDNSVLTGCRPVNKSQISSATPYKELEKMRKTAAARQLRKRKSIVVSPTTQTANNLFDRLKDTVENEEKIMLVDTKLVDRDGVYNMSSSGEDDQDFKTKKVVSRKNANSDKSKKTKRSTKLATKPKLDSNSKENLNSKQIVLRRTRSKSKQQMHKNILPPEPIIDLVDERMREAPAEALNTSLVIESREKELNIDLEPAHKIPRMEIVPHDKECEIVSAPMPKVTKKLNKNIKQRAKGRKNITNNKLEITTDRVDDDGKTISPLPSLEIETAQKIVEPDDSIAMLDKLNDKYEGDFIGFDPTQNLLSESEQVHISCNSKINNTIIETKRVRNVGSSSSDSSNTSIVRKPVVVLDKLDFHYPKSRSNIGRGSDTAHGDILKSPPQVKEIRKTIPRQSVEIEEFSEDKKSNRKKSNASLETVRVYSARPSSDISNKSIDKNLAVAKDRNATNNSISISTLGSCPITAHGDVDESPPKVKEIERTIPGRSLETEECSKAFIDLYNKLANDLDVDTNYSSRCSKRCKSAEKSQTELDASNKENMIGKSPIFKTAIERSPTVIIRRLSQREIDSHLIVSRNLVFDSPSTSKTEVSVRKTKEQIIRKSQRLRRSMISPISIDVDTFKSRRLSSKEVRTSPSKKSEPEKSEHSNRYDLRKFGKTYSVKGKSQCTNYAVLTQSDGQASVSVAKMQTANSALLTQSDGQTTVSVAKMQTANSALLTQSEGQATVSVAKMQTANSALLTQSDGQASVSVAKMQTANSALLTQSDGQATVSVAKMQTANSALLTQSDGQASVSVAKKQTVDSKTTTVSCEVKPSGSSVDDWFRRNERRPRGNRERGLVNEVLSGVLEKLDTTLFEIHQNTRNSIIKMLARIKSDLEHNREERNKAILALLDKISKEQEDRIFDNLRTTARDVIREENTKKRNLLTLLREDIQAAMTTIESADND